MQLRQILAVGVKDLQAVVLVVGNIDVAIVVNGHIGGAVELAVAGAGAAEFHQKAAVGGKLLDAVVAPVGYIDIAVIVNCDAPGVAELAFAVALRSPLGDKAAVFAEHLHTMVAAVHHIKPVVGVKGQAGRAVDFAIAGAGDAPFANPVAVLGKDGDAVQPFVGDIGVVGAVQGYGSGPEKGAVVRGRHGVLGADFFAEFAQIFLVNGADSNPLAGKESGGFGAAAQYIQPVAGAAFDGHRVEKPVAAARFLASDGVAVLKRHGRNLSNHVNFTSHGRAGPLPRPAWSLRTGRAGGAGSRYLMKSKCS